MPPPATLRLSRVSLTLLLLLWWTAGGRGSQLGAPTGTCASDADILTLPRSASLVAHLGGHPTAVEDVELSRTGTWAATLSREIVRLWRIDPDGSALTEVPIAGLGQAQPPFHDIALSPDDRWLAIAHEGGVRLMGLDPTRQDPAGIALAPRERATALAFDGSGELLAAVTGPRGSSARVWSIEPTGRPSELAAIPTRGYDQLALAGRWCLLSWMDGTTATPLPLSGAASLEAYRLTAEVPVTEPQPIAASTPDGRLLLAASHDGAHLWEMDPTACRPPVEIAVLGIEGFPPTSLAAISPDGLWAATGYQGAVAVWYIGEPRAATLTAEYMGDLEVGATFSSSGYFLTYGSRQARLWRLDPGPPPSAAPACWLGPNRGCVDAADFSGDGRWVMLGGSDGAGGQAALWRLDTGTPPPTAAAAADVDHVFCDPITTSGPPLLALSRDGSLALAPSGWRGAALCRVDQGALAVIQELDIQELEGGGPPQPDEWGFPYSVTLGALSPDGRWAMAGTHCGHATLWSLRDGVAVEEAVIAAPRMPGQRGNRLLGERSSFAFSHDGRRALCGLVAGTVEMWSLEDLGPPAVVALGPSHDSWVSSVSFSPDDGWAITCSSDGQTLLWRLGATAAEGTAVAFSARGGQTARFSPDGRLVLGASTEGAVLWEVDEWGRLAEVGRLDTSGGWPTLVDFLPGGRWALVVTEYDTWLWDLSPGERGTAGEARQIMGGFRWAALTADGRTLLGSSYYSGELVLLRLFGMRTLRIGADTLVWGASVEQPASPPVVRVEGSAHPVDGQILVDIDVSNEGGGTAYLLRADLSVGSGQRPDSIQPVLFGTMAPGETVRRRLVLPLAPPGDVQSCTLTLTFREQWGNAPPPCTFDLTEEGRRE